MLKDINTYIGDQRFLEQMVNQIVRVVGEPVTQLELSKILITLSVDFGIKSPTEKQLQIIWALLEGDSSKGITRCKMMLLVKHMLELVSKSLEDAISGHFERLIMSIRQSPAYR